GRIGRVVGCRRPGGPGRSLDLPVLRGGGFAVGADHVDSVLLQIRMELSHLFLGDLDLLEALRDLLEGQEAALLALADKGSKLLDLSDRSFIREQCLWLRTHVATFVDATSGQRAVPGQPSPVVKLFPPPTSATEAAMGLSLVSPRSLAGQLPADRCE